MTGAVETEAPETEEEEIVVELPPEEGGDEATPEPQPAPEPVKEPEQAPQPEPEGAPEQPADPSKPAPEEEEDWGDIPPEAKQRFNKRVNKLTYRYRKAETEAASARQQLDELKRQLADKEKQWEQRVGQSDDLIIAAREQAIEADIARVNDRYLHAYRTGDEEGLLKAQTELARLTVGQQELERVKRNRESMKTAPQPEPQVTQPQQQDWQELTRKADELAGDFVSEHSHLWERDFAFTTMVKGIDNALKMEGRLKPWEPEFYQELTRQVRENLPHKFGAIPMSQPSAPSQPSRPSQPVAGVSRGGAAGPRKVQLDADELRIARSFGLTPEEYGRQKLEVAKARG